MKRLKIYMLLLMMLFTAMACDEEFEAYDGPLQIEFAESFRGGSRLLLVESSGQVFEVGIPIQLVGTQQSGDITVSFAIDADNTTAIEGVHFEFVDDNAVIAANSSIGNVNIRVFGDAFADPSDVRTLTLELTGTSEGILSENYKRVEIELSITCPSDLAGDYSYTDGNFKEVTVTELSSGVYSISADNAFTADYAFTVEDVCNELTVTGGDIEGFGVAISGTGTVDPSTGVITLSYTVDGYFEDRIMTLRPM